MDWNMPTTQLMGKFKKWTARDTDLFKPALTKTGQVIIQVQEIEGVEFDKRKINIIEQLTQAGFYHQHEFEVMSVPNIIHLTYTPNKNYIVEKVAV